MNYNVLKKMLIAVFAIISVTNTFATETKTTVNSEANKISLPIKVCVLDFISIDTVAQEKFLNGYNNYISIPEKSTLNDADRSSINSIMQGFVRMIDAWDNTKTNDANRISQIEDNKFARAEALNLYNKIANGKSRPMVIGAEYLTAYLGQKNKVFSCVNSSSVLNAMEQIQSQKSFPNNFMSELSKKTGVDYLIYGTVSDVRSKTNSFKGYSISTKTTNYQLDLIIKVVDLASQGTVYSNVFTGNYREQNPVSNTQIDNDIFQTLMKSAIQQCADNLYDFFESKQNVNSKDGGKL